ncbi:MAG: hypothetical protein HC769_16200 [Cyanobacteria bacterium CRU_2_1]|nr:hypothetical protein [Cyanobacteria bacterium RU_5_0]NJR60237.1 hypothetical protein [Cyanobacteria bacterium CRU_2_1]
MSITSEQLSEQIAQILALTEANTQAIASLEQRQSASQDQLDNLRASVIELRESQAAVIQQFCVEQKTTADEFRRLIDATLARLERTLECMLADAENQGKLINEIKQLSLRLVLGQQHQN